MMRRLLIAGFTGLAVLSLLVGCQQIRNSGTPALTPPPESGFRVATYNVHYIFMNEENGRWSQAAWQGRKGPLDATFKTIEADIVAFQEMESFSGGNDDNVNLARSWLLERNPAFKAAAIGGWRTFPSTQPIFYRNDRFEVVSQGWFFFSDTPNVIYSRTFDGSYPAFKSWADLRDLQSRRVFRVLNVHLDYSSRENRLKSTALIAERISAWRDEGHVIVLAGDLNARLGSSLHEMLEAAGITFARVKGATYHFDRGLNLFGAIDHIGVSPEIGFIGPAVVYREKLGPVWPTDHYPVVIDVELR